LGLFAFLIFVCRSTVNAFAAHEGAAVFFPFLALPAMTRIGCVSLKETHPIPFRCQN
jgi:hypothetical protein